MKPVITKVPIVCALLCYTFGMSLSYAQTITVGGLVAPDMVCGGSSSSISLTDNECNSFESVLWTVSNATLSNNDFELISSTWSATESAQTSAIHVTYVCRIDDTHSGSKFGDKTITIFNLATPVMTNSDPTAIDCGARTMTLQVSTTYGSYQGNSHPPVTFAWQYPSCWSFTKFGNGSVADLITNSDGYGQVKFTVAENTCNQSKSASKSFTRIVPAPDVTITSNPVTSQTRQDFIKVSGSASIPNGSSVNFLAGNYILLEPSFETILGASLVAEINPSLGPQCTPVLCGNSFGKTDGLSFFKEDEQQDQSLNKKEKAATEEILIKPNPSKSFFEIKLPTTNNDRYQYTLFDIEGRSILNGEAQMQARVNMEAFKSGLYFLEVRNSHNGKVTLKKVFKE